jgi:hypothetical protein
MKLFLNVNNVNLQIWIIEKDLCDNVAYSFYPCQQSELKFSFPNQDRMCLFPSFLESNLGSTTIISNQKYFILRNKYERRFIE